MALSEAEMDEMKEIVADFLVEADELVGSLDENLVRLEETPHDLALLNEIFRAAHTIKGTSGFLGLDLIQSLTHSMEDVLNKLRKDELQVNADIMDVVLRSVDSLKILLGDVADGRESTLEISGLKAQLTAIAEGTTAATAPSAVSVPLPITAPTPERAPVDRVIYEAPAEEKPASVTESTTPTGAKAPVPAAKEGTEKRLKDQTIRVDVNRLDTLMNLMGELVLGRNALLQVSNQLVKDHESLTGVQTLSRTSTQINFITSEIQLAVMKMRMLPVGKVFGKFPRLVRDLARDAKKKIDLEIFGEETELDRSVIEEIGDPLVHLIRNSCDHGIEQPEDRLAKGKSEGGLIRLGASQEGSNIVISIEDNGRGLDVDAIRKKAVERGLASADEVERMSDRDAFKFIFLPGFSTAKKITDVSGRGVGMDVVKTNIEKLKGMIEIESRPNEGTKIIIKLPLTLAILQGLLVVSGGETYVIPLASVLETVRVSDEDIETVNRREVIVLRDGVLPLVNLNQLLKKGAPRGQKVDKPYVVVVGLAEKKLGLIVDELLGQEEVVIKSMGSFLGHTGGVAGATIAGDGRVRLIVDMIGLFDLISQA
jgi:two-component system, chemotaxis family, sensor kinase CheA